MVRRGSWHTELFITVTQRGMARVSAEAAGCRVRRKSSHGRGGDTGTPCCLDRVGEGRGVGEGDALANGVWAAGQEWNIEIEGGSGPLASRCFNN